MTPPIVSLCSAFGKRRREMIFARPRVQHLYDPQWEHDACGIGAVVNISGRRDHAIVEHGRQVLLNLMHRGASGADESTGDGAGILLQIPHEFFSAEADALGFQLPAAKKYGVGMLFLPRSEELRRRCEQLFALSLEKDGLAVLGWRDVPADNNCLGELARASEPYVRQVFIGGNPLEDEGLERRLYVARKRIEKRLREMLGVEVDQFYVPSMSCRTLIYKGMFLAPQLFAYYPDLSDARVKTALAIVHQRYSTNTFPSWRLAQPFRMIAHNGEINTLRGNTSRLHGKEKIMVGTGALRRHVGALPDPGTGRKRLGVFRQRHGASGASGPLRSPRLDDDDSRGVRAPVSHLDRQAGVLRVSRGHHGALGWAGRDGLHRRAAGGRHARPQRAPALPLRRHQGGPGRSFQRGGRDRVSARADSTERPSSARPHVPGRYGRRPDRGRQRDQGEDFASEALPPLARGKPHRIARLVSALEARGDRSQDAGPTAPLLRLYGRRFADDRGADGGQRPGADRLDGHRYAAGRAFQAAQAVVQLFQATLRPGDQSADRSAPRGAGHVADVLHRQAAKSAGRDAGALPPTEALAPDPDQRRHGAAPLGRPRRFQDRHLALAVSRQRFPIRPGR